MGVRASGVEFSGGSSGVATSLAPGCTGTDLTLTGALGAGAATLASAAVTGAATVGTTLGVTGATTLGGAVAVNNDLTMAVNRQLLIDDGALGGPGLAFRLDMDTGLRRTAANSMAVVTGSADLATAAGTLAMATGKQILADPGTDAAPGVAFVGATNTGMTNKASGVTGSLGLGRSSSNAVYISASGVEAVTPLLVSGGLVQQSALRIAPAATKVANYTATSSDVMVVMNGVGLTLTLPATPSGAQDIVVKNLDAGNLTIGGNGHNIDGAASLTLAGGAQATLAYNTLATTWYRVGA